MVDVSYNYERYWEPTRQWEVSPLRVVASPF